ncbi:GatB/YqeY domain-containing protein, partial [Thauera sp.]|uniref:GatB/YqeY domain-containing protein n=1 Tax=Thauera sp. TaxID=1905334 RepID=UPI002604A4D6
REAATQFASASRSDLEAKETEEAAILAAYLPAALSDAEVRALVEEAVASTGAAGVRDMGKVMNALRPKLQGRADMSQVSGLVKARLGG